MDAFKTLMASRGQPQKKRKTPELSKSKQHERRVNVSFRLRSRRFGLFRVVNWGVPATYITVELKGTTATTFFRP